jgi:hypothetical protein
VLKKGASFPSEKLSSEEALSYVRRYRVINEIAEQELKELSIIERLRQIAAAMRIGISLGFASHSDEDADLARKRWEELRRALG